MPGCSSYRAVPDPRLPPRPIRPAGASSLCTARSSGGRSGITNCVPGRSEMGAAGKGSLHAPVAQMAERRLCNPQVPGSTPGGS